MKCFFCHAVLCIVFLQCTSANPEIALQKYHLQLQTFRHEYRACDLPDIPFFLFGMGNRSKYIYKGGELKNALTGDVLYKWQIKSETIVPNDYKVILETVNRGRITINEDEEGVWLKGLSKKLLDGVSEKVKLPQFKNHKYGEILRVLHHEILINIVDSKPVPNFFVYKKPWRRDAAMMAMCLQKTGNLELIKDWVLGLDDPYDHNNGQRHFQPENEADNLGQTLYLLSLFIDKNFPLVEQILLEASRFEVKDENGKYIRGRSDFQETPLYQTKWLKFGLSRLSMADTYSIPMIPCNYSSLFWWDYQDRHVEGNGWRHDNYPYIGWARDHFYRKKTSPISNRDYPLTWESEASEADYSGMDLVDSIFVKRKTCAPHTWHAAEVFLYLLDENIRSDE